MTSAKQQAVLHPIVFALYPVALLYTAHKSLFDFSITYWPAAVSALLAGVLWLILSKVLGDWSKAAVATSATVVLFCSYSAIMRTVESFTKGSELDLWSRLVAGCIVAVILAALAAIRSSKHLGHINYLLNVVSIFLVASPLFQAAIGNFSTSSLRSLLPDREAFNENPIPEGTGPGPDIYYLVLDGYTRNDILQEQFGFDNAEMSEALAKRGFAVADSAIANYPYTLVSVSSTLNFVYLQDVFGDQLEPVSDQLFLRELMNETRAVRLLKSLGYRVIAYPSEYWGANLGNADVNLKKWWYLDHFSYGVVQMTPIPALLQAAGFPFLFDMHSERTIYPFEQVQDALDVSGPKFVYAHVFFGHPPFVFGKNGEKISSSGDYRWEAESNDPAAKQAFIEGYRDQVDYLNKRLLETIDQILAQSERDPIIIMHGDHGAGLLYDAESLEDTDIDERFSIFYAAHLPDGGNDEIYDSISPVNGLRVVFNKYFGADYELLEDRAYFAPQSQPYNYTLIPGFPKPPGSRSTLVTRTAGNDTGPPIPGSD